ncbi:MAG: sodium:solute symporter family protein [Candidatus Marinimicrobia bacterium]|mgnify:FL=1|jgi:SSS family solute:Na+ symporter|nr:sodium:solute symporter family protein [Candidatus Neomarinimicrobiota bacterium]|tara:strand:+ start:2114 stop:3973 length:1860 start_codon:yes stop_codon:yes gene_type:complete
MDLAVGTNLDRFVIIVYFVIVMGFGAYFGKYSKTTSDYFFGGRRFSWWLITISIVATGIGSHSFVKYSTKAYQYGFSSTMTYMNDWFFMPLFMFGWLPIIYYTRVGSIPEYFEKRFNKTARSLATLMILVYMIGYIAIQFLTLATALYRIYGIPLMATVVIIAVATTIYMHFGGQTSVIFTDLFQGLILIFSGLLLFFLGLNYLADHTALGGLQAFWQNLTPDQKLPLAHFNHPPDFNFVGIFWQDGIAGSVGFLFLNQGLIMRFMAARSVNEGRKAAAFNVLLVLPISAIVVSNAGWIGRAIANAVPGALPAGMEGNDVFVAVTNVVSSPGVFGFIIAALCAALMSTADTLVNASSAIIVNDVYRPLTKKKTNDKEQLKIARFTSIGVKVIAVILVPFFNSFDSIYEAHGWFHSTFTPPLVVAVFLGIFWKRFTTPAVIATFVLGAALMILGQFFPELVKPFSHGIELRPGRGYYYIGALYNIVVCAGVGVIVSLFTEPEPKEKLKGLTLSDVNSLREIFKGSKPNDRLGEKVTVFWKLIDSDKNIVRFSKHEMDKMAAEVGDLVYVSDSRKWLGGLKSIHSVYGEPHEEEGIIYISEEQLGHGQFVKDRSLIAEKEM